MDDKKLAEVSMTECKDFYGEGVSVKKAIEHYTIALDSHVNSAKFLRQQIRALTTMEKGYWNIE